MRNWKKVKGQSRLIVGTACCRQIRARMRMHRAPLSNSSWPRLFFHRNGNFGHGSQTEHVSVLIGPCIVIKGCSIYQGATLAIGSPVTCRYESLRHVVRLSNMTTVFGFHESLTWKSWPFVIWSIKNLSKISDSGSFHPSIPWMNSPLTNMAFSPVTGWTRIIGCELRMGSLRQRPPFALANLHIFSEEWVARRSSSIDLNPGDRRLEYLRIEKPIERKWENL